MDTAKEAARDCAALLKNRLKEMDADQQADWLKRWQEHFEPQVSDIAATLPPPPKPASRRKAGATS